MLENVLYQDGTNYNTALPPSLRANMCENTHRLQHLFKHYCSDDPLF